MLVGQYIKARRIDVGLTLRAAARQLDIDPAYLSRVEAGRVPPSAELLRKLAPLLRCPEDELFLLAGRLPESFQALGTRQPRRAVAALQMAARLCAAAPETSHGAPLVPTPGVRAIEDGFPFELVSEVAEVESWRKELYPPVYHIHKWWAQRLGSVFRAAILAALSPPGSAIMDLFYQPIRLHGVVLFDPFMGSGTIVGEAHKLGCTVIGRDINPVAYRAVRVALGPVEQADVQALFEQLERTVAPQIRRLYQSLDAEGRPCEALYFFWVKVLPCPRCGRRVDLFSKYVFATHANKRRNPTARILCPVCGAVLTARYDTSCIRCRCGARFNPQLGPARRTTAVCPDCHHEFPIAKTARAAGKPPEHRLYAKLVLKPDGTKEYLPATEADLARYEEARALLRRLDPALPRVPIRDGYNTRQILNYGYRYWHELFNDRQLLALSMLARAIQELPAGSAREALAVLFSGVLEFNNMFASYKGEGTGAVRHMFYHHILKPERCPVEANVWGTPKSSGAFSTLYKSRLWRALEYRAAPFEVAVEHAQRRKVGRKVLGISPPMGGPLHAAWPKASLPENAIYISCGDSATTDIPPRSVDLVVTDPPFFDNVHYSELADFFYVWQELYFGTELRGAYTTRREEEVQDKDPGRFAAKLQAVFAECHRVLRDDGLMIFSYHHSREEGWVALAHAVVGAGFRIVQSQPVKSEMSTAAPKSLATEPIDLDVLLVCRKQAADRRVRQEPVEALRRAVDTTVQRVARFSSVGRRLSRSDVRVVLLSQLLVELSAGRTAEELESAFVGLLPQAQATVESIWQRQDAKPPNASDPRDAPLRQLSLLKTSPSGKSSA